MKTAIFVATVAIIFTITFNACSYVNKKLGLKDDNIFEEIIEKQIENKTGLDFDLTPGTKET